MKKKLIIVAVVVIALIAWAQIENRLKHPSFTYAETGDN